MAGKLERKDMGDYAVYKKPRIPNPDQPNITQRVVARTIVPSNSEQDDEIRMEQGKESPALQRYTSLLKGAKGEL